MEEYHEVELLELVKSLRARMQDMEERYAQGEEIPTFNDDEIKLCETLTAQLLNAKEGDREGRKRILAIRDEVNVLRDKKARFELLTSSKRKKKKKQIDIESRMDSATEMLLESQKTLFETEATAGGIERDLSEQTHIIETSKEKVFTTAGLLGTAHRTLKSMENRETRKKLFAFAALGCVLLSFVLLVGYQFSEGKTSSAAPTMTPSQARETLSPSSR